MSKNYYSYQDVCLVPKYSKYHSRSEIDTSIGLGKQAFKLPVVPANMECTMNVDKARYMSKNGYFYIMHRFNKDKTEPANTDNKKFIELANTENWKNISISLGVKEEDEELIHYCITNKLRIDYITIDIAHAHSVRMKDMLGYINRMYRSNICSMERPFVIAGNVASSDAVVDLEDWGADATKVGIAAGKACRTYNETGFGIPMFSCILECSKVARRPIIADGGISECGDIAKALVAGASVVMAGGIFARSIDSPAETVYKNVSSNEYYAGGGPIIITKTYKQYYGSASSHNKTGDSHIEGTLIELECDGISYENKLRHMMGHLQSSISYSGGDLKNVEWRVKNSQKL